jgi:hypothetical protein
MYFCRSFGNNRRNTDGCQSWGRIYKGKEGDITATGGIQPYSWRLIIDPANIQNLDWLTIDPTTGVLSNKPGKLPNTPYPDGIKFKLFLNDNSVKGKDFRPDNVGISEEVVLKVNDCDRPCTIDGPTECDYYCEIYFGDCTKWVETPDHCSTLNASQCVADVTKVQKCIPYGSTGCFSWSTEDCGPDKICKD